MGACFSSPTPFSYGALVGIFEGNLTEKYDILRQLGTGRQGKTFLVRAKREQKNLFVAKESHEKDPIAIADLRKEFDYLKRLQHPNILKVVELVLGNELEDGQWTNRLYVISELAAGSDLLQYMKKMIDHQCAVREDWMAKVFQQIMGGVAYLHSERVIHSDLKPDNILCIQEFRPDAPDVVPWVTVTDFGCAKVKDECEFVCGDPRYQPPETLRALAAHLKGQETEKLDRAIGFEADIWSLGATLFELLSGGVIPFIYEALHLDDVTHNSGRWEKLKQKVFQEDLELDPWLSDASDPARQLIEKMLRKDAHSRPSALEVLEDEWFTWQSLQTLSSENLARLELKKTKGTAHTLLLNAMAMKLKRSHYEESWKVFQKIDTDKDGTLSLEEFQQAFTELEMSPSCSSLCKSPLSKDDHEDPQGAWLKHIFTMADIDKNGRLNFPEFVAVTFDWSSLETPVLNNILGRLFDQLDSDHNGQVSLEELAALFKGALTWSELEQVCARIDADQDGFVTREELHNFLFQSISEEDLTRLSATASINIYKTQSKSVMPKQSMPRSYLTRLCMGTCMQGIKGFRAL